MGEPTLSTPPVLPYAQLPRRGFGRLRRIALAAAWIYPLLPLCVLYGTWLAAWIALGHRPGFGDPTNKFARSIITLLLVNFPLGTIFGIVIGAALTGLQFHSHHCGARGPLLSAQLITLLVGLYAGAWILLWWDPQRALQWYID